MKAQALLAAVALVAGTHAFAQSSPSAAGSYDWGQSQVRKLYASPYARPSDAVAATAQRKRLTEAGSEHEDHETNASTSTTHKAGGSGKLACLGMGSTLAGSDCHRGGEPGLSLHPQQGLGH